MSKQDTPSSTVNETWERVAHRLHELQAQHQLQPLRDLFTRELNYRYANERLNLPDVKSQELLFENENPRIIATNDDGEFAIIYIRLCDSLDAIPNFDSSALFVLSLQPKIVEYDGGKYFLVPPNYL